MAGITVGAILFFTLLFVIVCYSVRRRTSAQVSHFWYTVNFLNIRTPKIFVVITLKFELCGSTIE